MRPPAAATSWGIEANYGCQYTLRFEPAHSRGPEIAGHHSSSCRSEALSSRRSFNTRTRFSDDACDPHHLMARAVNEDVIGRFSEADEAVCKAPEGVTRVA